MSEAYITDPFFYALAAPAVLLLGLSKSGFGAGFGSLAVPIIAMAITVPQAAAILMPILLVMDLLGLHAFRREYDVKLLKFLIPWGMVGIGVGFLLFRYMESRWVAGLVGLKDVALQVDFYFGKAYGCYQCRKVFATTA